VCVSWSVSRLANPRGRLPSRMTLTSAQAVGACVTRARFASSSTAIARGRVTLGTRRETHPLNHPPRETRSRSAREPTSPQGLVCPPVDRATLRRVDQGGPGDDSGRGPAKDSAPRSCKRLGGGATARGVQAAAHPPALAGSAIAPSACRTLDRPRLKFLSLMTCADSDALRVAGGDQSAVRNLAHTATRVQRPPYARCAAPRVAP